jgi:hypothetical protein
MEAGNGTESDLTDRQTDRQQTSSPTTLVDFSLNEGTGERGERRSARQGW